MHRCVPPLRRRSLFGLTAAAAAFAVCSPFKASAQGATRIFPATALRGEMVVTQAPEILLNQQPSRLAPGARIRGADNLLLLSGQLTGQRLLVHYTRDAMGQLLDVWVLTAAEQARRPWPSTPEQAQAWVFNPDAQTWSPR